MPGIVVAAAGTGAGKTLVTRALCAALRARGRRVQPYKIGPDYIDPRITGAIAGRPAYNVDAWLDGIDGVRAHVDATRGDADALVFEAMMGLYDGDDDGLTSSAAVAIALDAPVLLVLDGWSASQTLAAVAAGLRDYDPRVRIAGAILNRAGGTAHAAAVRDALARTGIPLVATLPFEARFGAGEVHLGLDAAGALAGDAAIRELGATLAAACDLDALVPPLAPLPVAEHDDEGGVPVAVAHDEAFWFTYPETLLALRHAGARIVPFSPLADSALPSGVRALWIGGGYPEDHATRLAQNAPMRRALREAAESGMPVYAECGGMMLLGDAIETAEGTFAMCGVVRGTTSLRTPALTIGYRAVHAAADGPLDRAGDAVRGYEFHYATGALAGPAAYVTADGRTEGVRHRGVLASFLHRHFRSGDPALARFVACAR